MTFAIEHRSNGITWVSIDRANMSEISRWCHETGCGKQINFKQISFKNESELTIFLIRWGNHDSSVRR